MNAHASVPTNLAMPLQTEMVVGVKHIKYHVYQVQMLIIILCFQVLFVKQ